jgi:hypothetical protein
MERWRWLGDKSRLQNTASIIIKVYWNRIRGHSSRLKPGGDSCRWTQFPTTHLPTELAIVSIFPWADSDKLLYGLKQRTKKESPCSAYITPWVNKPTVNLNGNLQNEAIIGNEKWSEWADLLHHSVNKVLPYWKESVRRNSFYQVLGAKIWYVLCSCRKTSGWDVV